MLETGQEEAGRGLMKEEVEIAANPVSGGTASHKALVQVERNVTRCNTTPLLRQKGLL